jgi:hypothetical protein
MPTLRNTATGGLQVVTDDQARQLEEEYPGVWGPATDDVAGPTLPYDQWKVSELRGAIEWLNLEVVSPSGANGQVVKSDLVDVLEAYDEDVPAEGEYVGLTDEEEVPDDEE